MVKLLKASLFLATTISVAAIPIPKSAIEPNVATYEDTQGSGIEKRHHHWTPIELVMYDLGKVDDNMNTFTDRVGYILIPLHSYSPFSHQLPHTQFSQAEQYDGGFWAAVHIAHNLKHMAKYIKKADKSSEGLEPINTDDSNSLMDMMNKLDPDTQDALEALKGKKDVSYISLSLL